MTDKYVYAYTGLTGGTSDDLDSLAGTGLIDGDMAVVKTGNNVYFYNLDASSGAAENSPYIISPDSDAGNKRWILQGTYRYQTETIFIPIEDMIDGTSAPAAAATYTSGVGKVQARAFDSGADEDVVYPWEVPSDIIASDGITFDVELLVVSATGPSNEGVAFFLQGFCIGTGDALGGTFGTAVKSSITAQTEVQYDRIVTTVSGTVTVTDLAGGELALLKLYRDVSDGDDTYLQDVGVTGIRLTYTRAISK